ncbi:MAG: sulfatase [Armatimonadetes bacterium CG06_land_8_20_14_3_00_66_21]|nr:MAG: sulfatase [Armatimonadetes bacterium CG06_land_8_20_14_3_00_66_21]
MPNSQPNVLLYLADTHRGDHLGLAGHPIVETPNIDNMVNRGAYFPNAYTEVPSTTAAQRVMLSGKGSYDCGQLGYAEARWGEKNTLAKVLSDNGYQCFSIGCRNFYPQRKRYGFHRVLLTGCKDEPGGGDYPEWLRLHAGPTAHQWGHGIDTNGWGARPWHLEERFNPVNWTVDTTIDCLEKRDPDAPFFVWLSLGPPHAPFCPPQPFWDMYANRDIPGPIHGDWCERHNVTVPGPAPAAWHGSITPEQHHRMRVGYMGCVSHVDHELGRLKQRLQRLGLLKDTLILYVSDHGDMQFDHHLFRKTYAYEGSARVPFVIEYPAGWDRPMGTFDHLVGLQDLMPTVCDATGIEPPEGVTGRSVFDAMAGKPWRDFLHGEHSPCYSLEEAMHFLTDGREKYVWFPVTGQEQLFDLVNDRDEMHDLAAAPASADRVTFWRQRLIDYLGKRGDGFSDGTQLIRRTERWGADVE